MAKIGVEKLQKYRFLIDQQGTLASLDAKTRRCIDGALTETSLRPLFTNLFADNQDTATQALSAPLTKCVTQSLPSK